MGTKISAVFLQPHLLHREGEQQWPKHLTEADFRAVLAAAVTVAIEEVAAVTAAAEVAAAEVAGEGKRTRTSGPRARSWGDWCKRVKSNRSSKSTSTPSQSKSTKSSITSSAPTWWMKS